MLAAQAQHGCAGDVGVVDVAGQQTAERLRILARAAAAALVGKKANAIEIGKDALGMRRRQCCVGRVPLPLALLLDELAHMLAIAVLRAAVAQLFFERLSHPLHVAVLAKHQRQHNPVVARAHLAVGRWKPMKVRAAHADASGGANGGGLARGRVVAGAVAHVARGEQAAARNGRGDFAHHHAVHQDQVAGLEINQRHLVLGGNVLGDGARCVPEVHNRSGAERR